MRLLRECFSGGQSRLLELTPQVVTIILASCVVHVTLSSHDLWSQMIPLTMSEVIFSLITSLALYCVV